MEISIILFIIGLLGFVLNRKNIILMIISIKIMLLSITLLILISLFTLDYIMAQILTALYFTDFLIPVLIIGLAIYILIYLILTNDTSLRYKSIPKPKSIVSIVNHKVSYFSKIKSMFNINFIVSTVLSIIFALVIKYYYNYYFDINVLYDLSDSLFALHFAILAFLRRLIFISLEHIEFDKHILNMIPAGGDNSTGDNRGSSIGSSIGSGTGSETGLGTISGTGSGGGQSSTTNPIPSRRTTPRRSYLDTILNTPPSTIAGGSGQNVTTSTAGSSGQNATISITRSTEQNTSTVARVDSQTVPPTRSLTELFPPVKQHIPPITQLVVPQPVPPAMQPAPRIWEPDFRRATRVIAFNDYLPDRGGTVDGIITPPVMNDYDKNIITGISTGKHLPYPLGPHTTQPTATKLANNLFCWYLEHPNGWRYYFSTAEERHAIKVLRTIHDPNYDMGNNNMPLNTKSFRDWLASLY
jgi:NADH-ubiquinone oxidoreductase chain 4L